MAGAVGDSGSRHVGTLGDALGKSLWAWNRRAQRGTRQGEAKTFCAV